jgi:hypothetical protein
MLATGFWPFERGSAPAAAGEARMNKNEFLVTASDGKVYTVVRIPSSAQRGALDGDYSQTGTYSYYLSNGVRLNPVGGNGYQTADGRLTVYFDAKSH